MYDYIKGKLVSRQPAGAKGASLVVENNGIGYLINTTVRNVMSAGEENAEINEALIEGLTKKVEAKGNKSHAFTCDYKRMVFAYPKAHGKLKSIIDPNNFDVTGTFGVQEVSITGLDGTAQTYYVYVNSASTVSNFTMKFNY